MKLLKISALLFLLLPNTNCSAQNIEIADLIKKAHCVEGSESSSNEIHYINWSNLDTVFINTKKNYSCINYIICIDDKAYKKALRKNKEVKEIFISCEKNKEEIIIRLHTCQSSIEHYKQRYARPCDLSKTVVVCVLLDGVWYVRDGVSRPIDF
ncbi:MAG: hypothetical protein ACI9N1_002970 [Flavobacteriales bacterium]|jgi:hypothetical protein